MEKEVNCPVVGCIFSIGYNIIHEFTLHAELFHKNKKNKIPCIICILANKKTQDEVIFAKNLKDHVKSALHNEALTILKKKKYNLENESECTGINTPDNDTIMQDSPINIEHDDVSKIFFTKLETAHRRKVNTSDGAYPGLSKTDLAWKLFKLLTNTSDSTMMLISKIIKSDWFNIIDAQQMVNFWIISFFCGCFRGTC